MTMRPRLLICALALALGRVADAQSVTRWVIGGDRGQSWADVVERSIALDDSLVPGAIQPSRIPPGRNILRGLVRASGIAAQQNIFGFAWATTKDPVILARVDQLVGWNPRIWGLNPTVLRGLIDGDDLSPAFVHPAVFGGRTNSIVFFTMDLGVPVAVDSVVFFPPQSGFTEDNERQRNAFPVGYEVTRTNQPVDWLIFADEAVALGTPGYHPLDEVIGSTYSNNQSIVSLTPSLRFTRFLRFRFGGVQSTGMLAEVKAFGRGYPQKATYVSRVHAFAEPVSLGRIEWQFTRYRQSPEGRIIADPAAPVELAIETRAGSDDDPVDHFIYDQLGVPMLVSRSDYEAAFTVTQVSEEGAPGFQARREDDITNWDPWSVPYTASGEQIRSSDGGAYLQFRFDITTADPYAFGVLDSIAFEVSPLLADSVLAEVSLAGAPGRSGIAEVATGVDTALVYDLRTVVTGSRAGYDQIELEVPAGARFGSLEIDGEPAVEGTDYTLAGEQQLFRILLRELVTRDARFRIRYRTAIYQSSLFLGGRLLNSDVTAGLLPQSIEAGDANPEVGSDAILIVAAEGTTGRVLGELDVAVPVVTPNGDGINDAVTARFNIYAAVSGELRVVVYDLAGRRVRHLLDAAAAGGPYAPAWDGRDDDGRIVAPGVYVLRVEVSVDSGTRTRAAAIAVAY
jgi:hypothetical protein